MTLTIMNTFIDTIHTHNTPCCHLLVIRSKVTPKAVFVQACPINVPHDETLIRIRILSSHFCVESLSTYPFANCQTISALLARSTTWMTGQYNRKTRIDKSNPINKSKMRDWRYGHLPMILSICNRHTTVHIVS